jgi:restriction system protein
MSLSASASSSDQLVVGKPRAIHGVRSVTYQIELEHRGLHKHRLIKSSDPRVLEAKAAAQVNEWIAQWAKREEKVKQERAKARWRAATARDREAKRQYIDDSKAEAARLTGEAQALLETVRTTLAATLDRDDTISWSALEKAVPFETRRPQTRPRPAEPTARPSPVAPAPAQIPAPPNRSAPEFQPRLGLLDRLLRSRRETREREAQARYDTATRTWEEKQRRLTEAHQEAQQQWQTECDKIAALNTEDRRQWEAECERRAGYDAADRRQWESARDAHEQADRARQEAVADFKRRYRAKDPGAVEEYCDLVLSQSEYPEFMPTEWEMEFNGETGMLVVNYVLPAPDALPTLSEVKYTQSSDTYAEKHLNESQRAKLYDDFVYQVTLRTIHELFEADQVRALAAVVFNGVVTAVDRSTGNEVTSCIVSVQASREPFLAINLAQVEPKQCFRNLKGVGSSALHSVTAVPPVMTMRREDGRFISARDVASALDEGYNLATMPWEDFEHLIRQVFEAEFSAGGGEVKVTQASRDGGVDAVVFDPDPIRGGKMVIQAKRYANTVGVGAVRDLYGTLMNEGATKGILVTTSDYGPEAYEFAKGKPLSLLSGANLLHLLQKHGLKARIDLAEARAEAARRAAGSKS